MGRAMFSPDVVGTDKFLDLSDDAQLLYYRLGAEGTYGKIVGVKRIVRGYGSSLSTLDELYQNGYLFDHGGACWVRHFWVNNVYKEPNNKFAKTMPEIVSGAIGFEGDDFKSAFTRKALDKPYASLGEGSTDSDASPGTDAWSDSDASPDPYSGPPSKEKTDSGEGACGEGGRLHHCPDCGARCCTVMENGLIHGECEQDGHFFIEPTTGEKVKGFI